MMNTLAITTAGDVAGAQSIGRAVRVLRHVGALGDAGLADMVAASGLPKPTVRRILLALIDAALVEQDPGTRRYHLGVETYVLGQLALDRFGVHDLAIDGLHRLARQSEDTAFLSVRRGFGTVCLLREEGRHPIRTHVLKPGDRHPLAAGAAGLAILSAMPHDDFEAALATNRPAIERDYPDLDIADTRARVAVARRIGWSLNPGLVFAGSWGIAAPVRDPRGRPIAALTLAAIESRLQADRQAQLGPLLCHEALRLEALLARIEHPDRTPLRKTAS